MDTESNSIAPSDSELIVQFFQSRKSKATATGYYRWISYILGYDQDQAIAYRKIAEFVSFARSSKVRTEYELRNWILDNKKKIAGATIRGYLAALKSLLEYCDVKINWKQIQSVMPQARRSANDAATPIEATRKLFRIAELRVKFLVSLFVSSGIRLGALNYLTVRDLEEFAIDAQVIGLLTVYRNEPEEYKTFVSSECLNIWREYKLERERSGEKITPDSPLVRNMTVFIQHNKERKWPMIRPLSSDSVRDLFADLWMKAGIIQRDFKQIHGWRKAYKTTLENSAIKSIRIERLLGHIQGLEQSYDKPNLETLARDYLKAMNTLTIDESLTAKAEVQEIKEHTTKELKDYKVDLILANQRIAQLEASEKKTVEELEEIKAMLRKKSS